MRIFWAFIETLSISCRDNFDISPMRSIVISK